VADAFGATCGKIGILIAMASIIGKCMLDSGAADRIVRRTLQLVGEARAGVAFAASSFVLGIPVFFDTVFYLMVPLAKAMRLRTGKNYLLYVLTILAGGSIAHSLVPPTPGPLYVADQMGINLGTMIAAGCAVGMVSAVAGYRYAQWANRRWHLDLDDSADQSLAELARLSARDERELPPTWLSLTPILLPVALITGSTLVSMAAKDAPPGGSCGWLAAFEPAVDLLGNKNVALILGAAVALAMLARHTRGSAEEIARKVQTALLGGGVIILITSAGGAFGAAMGQCGVAAEVARLSTYVHPALILPLAFGVTAILRGVQGSATVAMMTTVGLFGQLATSGTLDFHPVYLALAIGCGSKPLSWMNDSGFWVVCKMSGMTEAQGLRTITPQLTLMGLAGLAATMLGAAWFPLT
jgi:GntP family gluconate:H+ symporter